jgi:hypothetical protein
MKIENESRLDNCLDYVDMVNRDNWIIHPHHTMSFALDQCDTEVICQFVDTCCRVNNNLHSKIQVVVLLNAFNEWSGDFWSLERFVVVMKSRGVKTKYSKVFGLFTDCFIHIDLVRVSY